jgi:mannosyltransferase OCH1-like enzyme
MNSTVVVPRIIHQTWKTADVPDIWHHARKCVSVRLHVPCRRVIACECAQCRASMRSVRRHELNASIHLLRRECQRLHPGYEFKLWTDASAREMIAKDYPEYLAMYDGYKYGIQVRERCHPDMLRLLVPMSFSCEPVLGQQGAP